MKITRTRYQQGSIRRVPRTAGFAWEVRFGESVGGVRKQDSLFFSGSQYPAEASVREAIQQTVVLESRRAERGKVDAAFGALCALYPREHLATLRHSTHGTNDYLLRDYIEPR